MKKCIVNVNKANLIQGLKNICQLVFRKMSKTEEMNSDSINNNSEVQDGVIEEPSADGIAEAEGTEEEVNGESGPTAQSEDESSDEESAEVELSPEEQRIAELEEALAAAEAQAADNLDRLQRSAAEFQNTKRRQEKQLSDSIARAAESVVKGLLPVMDDFDLAFKNLPEGLSVDDDPWVAGFSQIQKKLGQLLEDQGVKMMDFEGAFDPSKHEAVSSEPSEDVESGQIIETLRAGYEYKEKVLRPALVRVAM